MDAVALICGLVWTNIAALIEVGISPTPAPSTPPSVLLLRALARLPHDGESIADMLMLATSIGVRPTELILLLRRSLDAGYLRDRPSVGSKEVVEHVVHSPSCKHPFWSVH